MFITEKKTEESKFVEGCHSDVTIEGSGEKLLHLLEKLSKKQPIQTSEMYSSQCLSIRRTH